MTNADVLNENTPPLLRALNPDLDARNLAILQERADVYRRRTEPQVGDFVHMLDGTLRRFTEDWGEDIQTTCARCIGGDRFYLSIQGASFSGGLDPPVLKARLRDSGETRNGTFWFFKNDLWQAHNDITVTLPCRVWKVQR